MFFRAAWSAMRAAPRVARDLAPVITALATVAMFLATLGYLYLTHRLVVLANQPSVEVLTPRPTNWDDEEPLLDLQVANRGSTAATDVRIDVFLLCCTDIEKLASAQNPWIRKIPILESPTIPAGLTLIKSTRMKEFSPLLKSESKAPGGDIFVVVAINFERPPVSLLDRDTSKSAVFAFDWNGVLKRWNISDSLTRERILSALSRSGAL